MGSQDVTVKFVPGLALDFEQLLNLFIYGYGYG